MLVRGIKGEEIAQKARMDRRRSGLRKRADEALVERRAGNSGQRSMQELAGRHKRVRVMVASLLERRFGGM